MRSSSRTPSSASSCTATTWCPRRAPRPPSLDEAGLLGQIAHALELVARLGGLLFGCGVALQDAQWREPGRGGRRLDGLLDRADERLARIVGNAGRREEGEPDAEEILRIAEVAHRAQVGKLRHA